MKLAKKLKHQKFIRHQSPSFTVQTTSLIRDNTAPGAGIRYKSATQDRITQFFQTPAYPLLTTIQGKCFLCPKRTTLIDLKSKCGVKSHIGRRKDTAPSRTVRLKNV